MTIIAREKQGEMSFVGEVNERLPKVTRGLVAHYPFDGSTDEYFSSTNILRTTDLTNSAWSKQADVSVVDVTSTVAPPIVGEKVYKVTKNCTTTDTHTVYYNRVDTLILGGTTGTAKIRVKKGTSDSILFGLAWYTPAYYGFVVYYFSTNTFGYGDTSQAIHAKAVPLNDGWIEISFDYANYTSTSAGHLLIKADTSTTSGLYTYFCKPEVRADLQPVSSANIAFSKTGLEITQSTTNLVVNSENLNLVGNSGATVTQIPNSDIVPPFKGAKVWKLMKNMLTQWYGQCYDQVAGYSSTNACLSMFVKKGNHPRMSLYILDYTITSYPAWATFDFNTGTWSNSETFQGNRGVKYVGDGWYYIYISTSAFTSGGNLQWSFTCNRDAISVYGSQAPVGTYCYVSSPQLTQNSYPLFYTPNGKLRGNAFINLPTTIVNPLSSGAIAIEFDYLCEAYMDSGKWMILWQSYSATNIEHNKINIAINNSTLLLRTAKADGTTSIIYFGTITNLKQGRNKLVYTWDKTNLVHKVVLNGTITSTAITANFPAATPDYVTVGNWTQSWHHFNSTIANVSTYNVYLTDDECKKLTSSPLSLTPTGNVISSIVVEEPVIPADAYYFPLSTDGRDRGGYVSPVLANNLVFEKGMCWSGNAVTNLITNGDCINSYPTYSIIGNATASLDTFISGQSSMKFQRSSSAPDLYSYMNLGNNAWTGMGSFAVGTSYTFQSKLFIPSSASKLLTAGVNAGNWIGICDRINSSSAERWDISDYDLNQLDKWQDIQASHLINADSTVAYARFLLICPTLANAPALYYRNIMLSASPFYAPFTSSTRGTSQLAYNLSSSLGLDWSGDWTIAHWVIPHGNSSLRQDAYTDNTLATYGWFGTMIGCTASVMASGVNSIIHIAAAPASAGKLGFRCDGITNQVLVSGGQNLVSASNFYDCVTPRLLCIRKQGTNIYFDVLSTKGETLKITGTLAITLSSSYYVTNGGIDTGILHDNGLITSGGNGYVYDMVVLKRFMTDTELQTMYNAQVSSNMQKLRVQRNIKEMVVLS